MSVLLLAVAACLDSRAETPPAWEYGVLWAPVSGCIVFEKPGDLPIAVHSDGTWDPTDLASRCLPGPLHLELNKLGAAGWDLRTGDGGRLYFARRK